MGECEARVYPEGCRTEVKRDDVVNGLHWAVVDRTAVYARVFGYDEEGRLVRIERDYGNGSLQVAYAYGYNSDGVRVWKGYNANWHYRHTGSELLMMDALQKVEVTTEVLSLLCLLRRSLNDLSCALGIFTCMRRRIANLGWLVLALTLASCTQAQNGVAKYDPDLIFGYDKTLPLSSQETLAEETAQYRVYKVTYRSARDQRVPAFLILPKNRGEEKLPCVILMHGLGGDKRMFQMLWGPLTQAGYALFAIDAQYHGERKPSDDIPFFGMYPYRARDALIQTVIDLRRGLDYLQTRKEIDPHRDRLYRREHGRDYRRNVRGRGRARESPRAAGCGRRLENLDGEERALDVARRREE